MFQWKMPVPWTELAKKVVLLIWILARYVFFGHILDFPKIPLAPLSLVGFYM